MPNTGQKPASDADAPVLNLILDELRGTREDQREYQKETRAELKEIRDQAQRTETRVALMQSRSIAIFGTEKRPGGQFVEVKQKVEKHHKVYSFFTGAIKTSPIWGGLIAGAITWWKKLKYGA